jgi:hypothetical protein
MQDYPVRAAQGAREPRASERTVQRQVLPEQQTHLPQLGLPPALPQPEGVQARERVGAPRQREPQSGTLALQPDAPPDWRRSRQGLRALPRSLERQLLVPP